MAGRLAGKVAVVTGAAPRGEGVGNGMATAILFAREGARVVLVNRSAERAEKLAKQIKQDGGEASVFAGDVARPDACEAMADHAMKTWGRLDILHNNVGIGAPGTPETVTLEDAAQLLTLPRVLGVSDGIEVTAQNGRYGPYVSREKESRSLDAEEKLFTITLDEALAHDGDPEEAGLVEDVEGGDSPLAAPGGEDEEVMNVDLEPGNYAMLCFIGGPDGTPHAFMGMAEEFTVE